MTSTLVPTGFRIESGNRLTHFDSDADLPVKLNRGGVTSSLGVEASYVLVTLDEDGEAQDLVTMHSALRWSDREAIGEAITVLSTVLDALTRMEGQQDA